MRGDDVSTERLAVVETEMKYVKVEMTEMKEDIKVVKDAVSSMSSLVNEMQEDRKLERQNKLEEQIEKRKIRIFLL